MPSPVTRGYGQISSDSSSASVTPDTAFMIASVSKPFTASAVAVLVDKGIISLDDDICDVIPAGYSDTMCRNQNHPNVKITWRMMITHRSSMKGNIPDAKDRWGDPISPSYGPSGGYTSDAPAVGNPTCPLGEIGDFYHALLTDDPNATTDVGAGVILQGGKELDWFDLAISNGSMWSRSKPGQRRDYSNAAYGFVSALIEFATGQSFPDFCREHLFEPLGMSHTEWFLDDLPDGSQVAVPVEKKRNGGYMDVGHYCFIDYASGQLRTSANDIARWSNAMLDYGSPMLWSTAVGKEIVKCQEKNVNGEPIGNNNCDFGYGWILLNNSMKQSTQEKWLKQGFSEYDWTDGVWHDGLEAGSQTNIVILPKAGIFVAVLTNTDLNSETAAQQLTQAVVEAPLPSLPPTPTPLSNPTLAPQPTRAPANPTRAPTNPTKAPTNPTRAPTNPSKAPTNPTRAPTNPTRAPTNPTKAPTNPTRAPTNPTRAPTNPTAAPQPDGKCPGEAEFVFSLETDDFPEETKWVLKRNNRVVKKRRYKTYKNPLSFYEESICVPLTGNYKFVIVDRYGDGVCCDKGDGSYEISFNGEVKRRGGDFRRRQRTNWSA